MSLLEIENLTHSFGEKRIFTNVNLRLLPGDHMGLTGLNGSGKSTLLNLMANRLDADTGTLAWQPKLRVGFLDQYASVDQSLCIRAYLQQAFAVLYDMERQVQRDHDAMETAEDPELTRLMSRAARLQTALEQQGFYQVDSTIARVAAGLGLTALGLDTELGHLSGGQRAKVLLAKLLLEAPDVLLLDEPTNFLDRSHIDWLAKFLRSFEGAFVLVSHDAAFLTEVTNCICDIEFCAVNRYSGNFASFQRQKEHKKEQYLRDYARQQQEIAKLEDYIARNLVRASTSNMAKSRRKKLEKIERMDKPVIAGRPHFAFAHKPVSEQVLLEVRKLSVGYDRTLLGGIDLKVRSGDKIAITGFNGIGKTTLLKTIAGSLPSRGGSFRFCDNIAVGYYEQDHAFRDPGLTPLQELLASFPKLAPKDARKWLSRCALRAEHAERRLSLLSGGEQAKVKLCKLMLGSYTLLVLDEPTNHLDVTAKEVLKEALAGFPGAVILVSHEQAFYRDLVGRVVNVEGYLGDR